MTRHVWVESWQLQCCGDPFEVGQEVTWTVAAAVDREYLGTVLGDEAAAAITDYEDHHDVVDVAVTALTATVKSIEAVSCRFAPQGPALYPVAGTAVVEGRTHADGWESETDVLKFLGSIVTLVEAKH